MTLLELNLIGVPEIVLDGQTIMFARRGSIALLAYLVLSHRAYPRETLATLLAGDSSEEQARKYLSNVLVDLHQHLGSYIRATRQTVVFDRSLPCRLDVELFQSKLGSVAEDELATGVESIIELYRGEFLAGLALSGAPDFDLWVFAQREELRGCYMEALRTQVGASLRSGEWSLGIAPARKLIAEEPWLEEAHRNLMVMLAHSGQRQAAIAQYHTCRRVLREELDVEPMPETTALFKRLRAAMSPPPHNLPVPSNSMVGRHAEMQMLSALLVDPDCRLITLTGMGGSGKTRLAIEVARTFASPLNMPAEQPFAEGITFVPLADPQIPDRELPGGALLAALACALDIEVRALGEYLKSREMLIVLDNVESIQAGAAEIDDLLRRAPHIKILATSRAPLHLELERVLNIGGLDLPASTTEIETADASGLFLQEARRVHVGFTLPEAQQQFLVQLCRQVGGFPLALVLAARWAPVLPCSEILRELADDIDVLAAPESDLPERHRSVRQLLDRTVSHLSSEEWALAQHLAESDTTPTRTMPEMLPGLRRLSEQALISIDSSRGTAHLNPLLSRYVRRGRLDQHAPARASLPGVARPAR